MGAVSHFARPPKVFRYSEKRRKYLTSRGYDVGMKFPAGDMQHDLRRRTKSRFFVTDDAAVFTSGVIEYLCAEILEQAGLFTSPEAPLTPDTLPSSKVIQPAHLKLVFWQDPELRQMLGNFLPAMPTHKIKHVADERDLCYAFQSLSVER
ncbi:hypothetical protein P691DRAFT_800146 [Macrolepiota fuliginosa MF-IS2]|uniref:Histone H2A n=1 Tax=Macrolepiota fuliginosa MF-IS2 TaxID=1400762 RepID=A0A9P6C922_9AGAR|nr:hypothetical protein P691DRAFT_800146 [Macrolepiota fuliginosa MF-IS2]